MDATTPFSDLMSKAVKLKGHQQAKLRPIFDSWPSYFQHSLFMQDSVTSTRSLPFQERLSTALLMKNKGNEHCGKGDMEEAVAEYEKALAVFSYCENQDANWKNKGIEDKDIRVTEYIAQDAVGQERLDALKIACYLNIALCKFRIKDFATCLRACDDALKIDGSNVKAIYRSAQALIAPLSAGALEFEQAIQRLKRAVSIDASNSDVGKLLRELQHQKKRQKVIDNKTFGGMFDRGQLYRNEELQKQCGKDGGANAKDDFEAQIRQAQDLARLYEHKGEHDQAETIRQTIAKVKSERFKSPVDFLRPTPEMIQDAKRNNIDLTDKNVQRMLNDLQQGKEAGNEETHDAINTEDQVETILRSMSSEAIGQLLQREGIPYQHLRDKGEILKLARHIINSKMSGNSKEFSQHGERSYMKWVIICAVLWTVLRLLVSGNLSLWKGFRVN